MVYFFMVNLLRLSSSWSAADQCELVQCKLVRGDTPPGAFAMAVTIVTEAVGTPPTNAN